MKKRSRRGFTLVEMLTATVIIALICVVISSILPVAVSAFQKVTLTNESDALYSTLQNAIKSELSESKNVISADGTVSWTSPNYGMAEFSTDNNGRIQIISGEKTFDLVADSTYTQGLKASATVSYESSVFTIDLTIMSLDGTATKQGVFHVRPLNA